MKPELYIVGGAVRDILLGRKPKDFDYVVVGATEKYMLDQGYKRVGEFFPVFLHPTENKEYALARKEKKVDGENSHTSFELEIDDVTLEEDLYRRDLTINAIAVHGDDIDHISESKLIDPYGGYGDLVSRVLRHVSPAFAEDPLRVLRVARFATRYDNFIMAPETIDVMKEVVRSGSLLGLSPERVWKEMEQVLMCRKPSIFFNTLNLVGAIQNIMPQLLESGWYEADNLEVGPELKFALILKDADLESINSLCTYLKVPTLYQETAIIVAKHHRMWTKTGVSTVAESIINVLKDIDAFRKPERVKMLRYATELLYKRDSHIWNCARALEECFDVCNRISFSDVDQSLTGRDIGLAIDRLRRVEILMYLSNGHNGKITTC